MAQLVINRALLLWNPSGWNGKVDFGTDSLASVLTFLFAETGVLSFARLVDIVRIVGRYTVLEKASAEVCLIIVKMMLKQRAVFIQWV